MIPATAQIPEYLRMVGVDKEQIAALMEQIEYFNNEAEIRDDLIHTYFEEECINKIVTEITKEIASLRKKSVTLLDVAAGTGFFLKLIAEALQKHGIEARPYGLDITPRMLENLRRKGITPIWGTGDHLIESIMINRVLGKEDIPLEYDVVISTLSLHHFINPDKVIKSIEYITKEDGLAVIIDITEYRDRELQEKMKDIHPGFSTDKILSMSEKYFRNPEVSIMDEVCCNVDNIICIPLFKAVLKKK